MPYAVSARLIPARGGEFFTRLTDGSIAAQRPDGQEIVAAMGRARIGRTERYAGPRPASVPRR